MSTSIKIPISSVIHIVRFTVPLLSCWLERALESAAPPLHFPRARPGRGCAGALRTSSVAGIGPSGLDVQPRPRGWKQRGLGAGEEAELSGGPVFGWLGLCGRGEGQASGIQRWET